MHSLPVMYQPGGEHRFISGANFFRYLDVK